MKKLILSLFAILVAGSVCAAPFSFSNFYADGFAGLNLVNDYKKQGVQIDYKTGFAVGGSIGYRFSPWFRIEGEGAYRQNSLDELWIRGVQLSASGKIKKATLMANGFIDFPMFDEVMAPYLSLGLGERWDRESLQLDPVITPEGIYLFDKVACRSSGVAYQVIAGVNIFNGKKVKATAEYRYSGPQKLDK